LAGGKTPSRRMASPAENHEWPRKSKTQAQNPSLGHPPCLFIPRRAQKGPSLPRISRRSSQVDQPAPPRPAGLVFALRPTEVQDQRQPMHPGRAEMELRRAIRDFSSGFRRGFRTEKQSQESLAFCHPNRGQAGCGHLETNDLSWASSGASVPTCCHCEEYFALDWFCNWLGDCFSPFRIQFGPWGIIGTHSEAAFVWGAFSGRFPHSSSDPVEDCPSRPWRPEGTSGAGILVVLALLAYRIVVFAFTGRFHLERIEHFKTVVDQMNSL